MPGNKPSPIADALRRYSVLIIFVGLCALLSLLSDRFLQVSNLLNVALQTSIVAITAIGMTFTMLTGGIDLSVGSLLALSSAVSAGLITKQGLPVFAGILVALAVGALLGAVSGLLVVKGHLPPFVATLAMMAAARGMTLVYTRGWTIPIMLKSFTFWGTGTIGPIPIPVVVLAVLLVVAYFVLSNTRFGLYVYAVGGNEETARLAGIPTDRVKLAVYVISGLTAAMAGVITAARLWSAQPNVGAGLELDAIAAPVLGGTSLFGGVGGVGGTIVGAFIMGVLNNGLNLLEVSSYSQRIIKGMAFVLAVGLDVYSKKRS
jgi:ribose transport system permease protein